MQHDRFDRLSPSINYLPCAAPSLSQQSLQEIFHIVFISIFIFRMFQALFPVLPFCMCTHKHRTNKLPCPGFSHSFRVYWSSFTWSSPLSLLSISFPFPRSRWSVPSTPRRDSARLALIWSGPASGQRPSDQRTLFLRVHNACVWIESRVRACAWSYVSACVRMYDGACIVYEGSRSRASEQMPESAAFSSSTCGRQTRSRSKKSSVATRSAAVAIVEVNHRRFINS